MSTNFLNLQSRVCNINARVFIVQLKYVVQNTMWLASAQVARETVHSGYFCFRRKTTISGRNNISGSWFINMSLHSNEPFYFRLFLVICCRRLH